MFKKLFRKRSLYLVYYEFHNIDNSSIEGNGSLDFKIFPKLNSYKKLEEVRNCIASEIRNISKCKDTDKIAIVIKNIIELD